MFKKILNKLKQNFKENLKPITLVYAALIAALIIIDLLTKHFEEKDKWYFNVIPKFIEVRYGSRNPGCAFSFLAEAEWGQTFLIVATFILLTLLIVVFLTLPEKLTVVKISLCLIIGGALGNLVDRIALKQVRDFVEVNMFGRMVSCNFADFFITFGTALLVLDFMFLNEYSVFPLTKRAKEAQRKANSEKDAPALTAEDTPDKVNENNSDAENSGDEN